MDMNELLRFLSVLEKLKATLRHSWISSGRQESVAEHSWRLAVFAWLLSNELEGVDTQKVIEMCLFHDIGEAVTGDIPSFNKTEDHTLKEAEAINSILDSLPEPVKTRLCGLINEMQAMETKEAKLAHALDKLEVVVQHNEAPLETWIPLEYDLNLTYAEKEIAEFPFLVELRKEIRKITELKISSGKGE